MTYTVINGVVCKPANKTVEAIAKSRFKKPLPCVEFPLQSPDFFNNKNKRRTN